MIALDRKRKKIISDVVLSLMSSVIPIMVLQLFVLPGVSRKVGGNVYGMVLTIISFITVLPGSFGNVFNNIRLLKQTDYEEEGQEGDFNVLYLISCPINLIAFIIFAYLYHFDITLSDAILIIIVALLVTAYEYLNVAFRITLDFASTFICNVILSAGYCLGFGLFSLIGVWPLIYLTGYFLALVYICYKSNIWKEKIQITPMFRGTLSESIMLLGAGLVARTITYADKFLIYPILGGNEVSIYYAASVIGKIISMMISPISSVLLSYLAKMKNQKNKLFWGTFGVSAGVGVVGYFLCLLASRFILQFLYPQYLDVAITYIPITTATAVIIALSAIMNPFVLRFMSMKWQVGINAVTLGIYVVLCLGMLNLFGMIGFCWGVLISNLVKLVTILLIYSIKSKGVKE